jgi:ligand-binding sensor domain-containing protein
MNMKNLILFMTCVLITLFSTAVSGQTFTNYTTANGLPDNNVNGVTIDGSNNKWFGTQSGVAKYNDTSWTVYTAANGIIDNYINCIAVDRSDNIWVGTDFGVSMFNGTGWISYTTVNGLVNNQINYIAADLNGNVWFATINGISVFDGSEWTTYTTSEGLPNNMTSYIAPDSAGNVWIGTWIGGLAKFNGATFQTFTMDDSLASNNIISIAIDPSGQKWIGTYSGISVLDNDDNWVRNYTEADGLYNNFIQDLDFDSDGVLWAGMYADYLQDGGVTKFTGSSWASYSVTEGLIDPQVKRLAADHSDNVWIVTGSGVSRWNNPSSGIDPDPVRGVFSLHPNPAENVIHLVHQGKMIVEILDLTGKVLLQSVLPANKEILDIGQLAPGIYLVRGKTAQSLYCIKLVVR